MEPEIRWTPPQGHETDAVFFKFFVDDDTSDSSAILVTASVSINVQINSDVKAGQHKLICRMYKHDGTPTTATSSIDFTVKTSVGPAAGADAATGPDAGVMEASARE